VHDGGMGTIADVSELPVVARTISYKNIMNSGCKAHISFYSPIWSIRRDVISTKLDECPGCWCLHQIA